MNKKGILGMIELGVYFIFVMIVAAFMATLSIRYLNEKIDTTALETFMLTKTLVNSDSCLAYKDDLRTYENIIDLKKVNSIRVANCFLKPTLGFIVNVKDLKGTILSSAKSLDARQEAYLPVCKGTKGYICTKRETPILYYDNGIISPGTISLEVINFVG